MKSPLAEFCEDIVVGRGQKTLGDGLRAYRMDGKQNGMRRRAGLGDGLACCDYLWTDERGRILIEETELWETVKSAREEYDALKSDEKARKKFIRGRILRENCLKVYGALLVLCRMKEWPGTGPFAFWLAVSGDAGAARAFQHWDPEDRLEEEITRALFGYAEGRNNPVVQGALTGARLVSEVRVITADELRAELLARAARP